MVSTYKLPDSNIAAIIERMVAAEVLIDKAGCSTTLTFHRKATRLEGFTRA